MLDSPETPLDNAQDLPELAGITPNLQDWETTPHLTVLQAQGGRKCVKTFSPGKVTKYDKVARFSYQEVRIMDFDGLVALLKNLEARDDRFIVSGRVTEHYRSQTCIPRRKKPRGVEPESLKDVGSFIAVFDCDDIDVPEGCSWLDPEGLAIAIWRILSERIPPLQNVRAFWQASASAGQASVVGKAKFHFWVLLDAPLLESQRRVLYKNAGTDERLSCSIQPHYVGRPLFKGVIDPLGSLPRSGVIQGDFERVRASELDLREAVESPKPANQKKRKSREPGSPTLTKALTSDSSTWGERQLEIACELILSAEARNVEINKQAYFIGGAVASGLIAEKVAYERLHEAAAATGHDRFEEALTNGFRDGLKAPLKWNSKPPKPEQIAPYYNGASEDRASATKASREMITTWAKEAIEFAKNPVESPTPRAMQYGMQGVGKTSALVGRVSTSKDGHHSSPGALHDAVGLVCAMYMPTHSKCEEAAKVYQDCAPEGAPPSMVIRGRGRPDPEGEPNQKMCMVSELADYLAKQGVTVRSTLCIKCPFQERCGYLKQERLVEQYVENGKGLVVFAPHTYAFLPLPAETDSDITIFDESPGSTVLERVSIPVADLLADLQFGGTMKRVPEKRANDAAADATQIAEDTVSPALKTIANAYCPENGLDLDKLREAGLDAESIDEVLDSLKLFMDKRAPRIVGNAMKRDGANASVASAAGKARELAGAFKKEAGPRIDHLRVFLEILKSELAKENRWPIAIVIQSGKLGELTAVRLKPLTHASDKPFLYIDGTGDPDLAKIMFGADLKPHLFAAERNAKVTQVVGNGFSTKSVLGESSQDDLVESSTADEGADRSTQLRERVQSVLDRKLDAAVFSTKKIREAIGLSSDERAGHFSAIRGLNHWEDRDVAIIIGREQPKLADMELNARAFALEAGRSLVSSGPIWEWRGIRTRNENDTQSVVVMTHPDPLVEKLLHQSREAEVEQAIDRLRLIHNEIPKEVFILNEIALNITVDRVVHWRDFWRGGTRPERATHLYCFLPLNGQEAVNLCPGIWSNRETANQDLKIFRSLVSDSAYEDILYTKPDAKAVCHVRYKRNVKRSRRAHWREGLVYCPREKAAETVEKRTGPLRGFEVIQEFLA